MRRALFVLLLVILVGFLAFGSGFALYWRLAYLGLLALIGGLAWSWLNLHGLELHLERLSSRSQVGVPIEGRITLRNNSRLPKAWLEVEELTDFPQAHNGRVVGLPGKKMRSWRHVVECQRRGVYNLGPVRISCGDPFGLFKLRRDFLERHRIVVYPHSEPLPHFNLSLAILPSDSGPTQRSQQTSIQAASVRPYIQGDSVNRVHWPSTARMGSLMVKEFDQGGSCDVWLVIDLQSEVQVGQGLDNTEELSVTVAASIANRLLGINVAVGLAAIGDTSYLLRPDRNPNQAECILECLAMMRAQGPDPLERTLYQLEPYVSRFNTLVVITPSTEATWSLPLSRMRKRGVRAVSILIDPNSFGGGKDVGRAMEQLQLQDIPVNLVKRGVTLDEALRSPASPPPIAAGTTRQRA